MKRIRDTFRLESKFLFFFLSVITVGVAYGIYKGMIDNYLAEIVSMGEFDRGVAEFFRELPGFLLVFILALLHNFSAEKLYKPGAVIIFSRLIRRL